MADLMKTPEAKTSQNCQHSTSIYISIKSVFIVFLWMYLAVLYVCWRRPTVEVWLQRLDNLVSGLHCVSWTCSQDTSRYCCAHVTSSRDVVETGAPAADAAAADGGGPRWRHTPAAYLCTSSKAVFANGLSERSQFSEHEITWCAALGAYTW